MDLNETATPDNLDAIIEAHIYTWAVQYLPLASAEAFSEWLHSEIDDWENEAISIREVLTGAWQTWTGDGYPNP